MNWSLLAQLSEVTAMHVDSAKSVNQEPQAHVAQTGRRLKTAEGLNFAGALHALCPTELETMNSASREFSVSASSGIPLDRYYQTLASKAPTLCSRPAGSFLPAAGERKKPAARPTDKRETALICSGRSARVSGDLWRWAGARFERLRRNLWDSPHQRRADYEKQRENEFKRQ
jgi:hypothetical protein